jgi:tRNA G18 (ribose-2'-O)-methylase SpoU
LVCTDNIEIDHESGSHQSLPNSLIIEALLDNIRSAWNVGSMFRTADGTGIQALYLCGITPTPGHPQISRTALGAENSIPWQYESNAKILTEYLISKGRRLWVLEDTSDAVSLFEMIPEVDTRPILLAVGNEVCGVDPALVELSECVISIPMAGLKRSYNVAVAFGIAASYLRYCQTFSQASSKMLPNT